MFLRAVALIAALAATPLAHAQTLFANPLADADSYRSARGELSTATQRFRYTEVRTVDGAETRTDITFDIASDWVLMRNGAATRLYDFRLNRFFALDANGTFSTTSGLAALNFRMYELGNRAIIRDALGAASERTAAQLPTHCDSSFELGTELPNHRRRTAFRERGAQTVFVCDDIEHGVFAPSTNAVGAAFWPTLFDMRPMHPALHRRMREAGRAPEMLELSYKESANAPVRVVWRLIGAEAISTPYPLEPGARNTTFAALEQVLGAGGAELAQGALAGRIQGGAPTLANWDRHMAEIARRDGDAAAAMLLAPAFNMFPSLNCDGGAPPTICRLTRSLRGLSDPAPWAVIEIGVAEGSRDLPTAISAMERAQRSPHRDHPALGAAFALAVTRFDDAATQRARAANLPLDVRAAQRRAITAFPYNPAYWTDLADSYSGAYDWFAATMLIDIALALPMPDAQANNQALAGKRQYFDQVLRYYPDVTLPR